MLIYVVNRGDLAYARHTKPLIRRYCRQHGYDLIFADCGHREDRAAAWQKMLVHEYVRASFVLVMDLDFIPLPWAPPIHKSLVTDSLNICRDTNLTDEEQRAREIRKGCPPFSMGYNTGLMGIPARLAPEFRRLYNEGETVGLWWEQPEVNLWIRDVRPPLYELDNKWNYVISPQPDGSYKLPEDWASKHFLHLAGCDSREKFAGEIREAIEFYCR